jgi:UDP-2,4-diacetamido-2,4,6-trideoxy-beta-L-altropyranose hydrolase
MGTGHAMRCLGLAQAWQDAGGKATFVTTSDVPAFKARLEADGIGVASLDLQAGGEDDSQHTIELMHELDAGWLMLDGYHFTSSYQRAIKDSGLDLLLVDDNGDADHYYADLVLNQNLHAHENLYSKRESYTRLLLGTRYALLRREFLKWREWKRVIRPLGRKVLVTLGGSDPDNITLRVMRALEQVPVDGIEAVVVVGSSNSHQEELETAARSANFPIRIETNVTNMSELMAVADVAISAGGSTCWELAFMGLPSVVLIVADHQRAVAERLHMSGSAVNLGWHRDCSVSEMAKTLRWMLQTPRVLARMADRGQQLVDGFGSQRIVQAMTEHVGSATIHSTRLTPAGSV